MAVLRERGQIWALGVKAYVTPPGVIDIRLYLVVKSAHSPMAKLRFDRAAN